MEKRTISDHNEMNNEAIKDGRLLMAPMQHRVLRMRQICASLESDNARQIWSLRSEELKRRKSVRYQGDVHVLGDMEEETTIQAKGSVAVWGMWHSWRRGCDD